MALRQFQLKRRHRSAILTGALMCLLLTVSCHQSEDPDVFLKQELTKLQEITIPPDAEVLPSSGPDSVTGSQTTNWEFRTEWRSEQYFRWVAPRLANSFQALGEHDSQLDFSRDLDGDAETVKIKVVSEGTRLRVRVTLEVYPD